jgi:hypothetical protein
MTGALSTTTVGTAGLDVMVKMLFAGRRDVRRFHNQDSATLMAALVAGGSADDVLMACRDDVALKFGVQLNEVGVLAYSPLVVAVAFTAQGVKGSFVETLEQRAERVRRESDEAFKVRRREAQEIAAERARLQRVTYTQIAADRDPVWLLWPWGRELPKHWADVDYMLNNLAVGVTNMLNGVWGAAIAPLQQAALQAAESLQPQELMVVRRSIAANIGLAVRYSHEGAA